MFSSTVTSPIKSLMRVCDRTVTSIKSLVRVCGLTLTSPIKSLMRVCGRTSLLLLSPWYVYVVVRHFSYLVPDACLWSHGQH